MGLSPPETLLGMLAELVIAPVLEFVLGVVAFQIGRGFVLMVSFGRWRCDPFLSIDDRPMNQSGRPEFLTLGLSPLTGRDESGWGGLWRRRHGRVVLPAEVTAGVGLLLLAGFAVGVFFVARFVREPATQTPEPEPVVALSPVHAVPRTRRSSWVRAAESNGFCTKPASPSPANRAVASSSV